MPGCAVSRLIKFALDGSQGSSWPSPKSGDLAGLVGISDTTTLEAASGPPLYGQVSRRVRGHNHASRYDVATPAMSASLCVPKTSSTSCDQAVFVDQASGMSGPSDAVPVEIDRFGEGFQRRAASRERCGRC